MNFLINAKFKKKLIRTSSKSKKLDLFYSIILLLTDNKYTHYPSF